MVPEKQMGAKKVTKTGLPSFVLLVLFLAGPAVTPAQASDCVSTATGNLEIVPFQSKIFGNTRMLRVLLPPDYDQSANRRYKVLYLNDGQDLYDVCTSIFNPEEWRVDETVDELVSLGKIEPIIVVGIDNAGRRLRPREYLPYPDDTLSPPEPHPQGKLYPLFLLDEVIPFIEARYRVQPGPANRALGGSSYGAGAALYTVVARPQTFAGLLLESPSVYASDYQLLKDAESVRRWPERIYIGTGTIREPVEDVKRLEELFGSAGLNKTRLLVVVQPGGKHTEASWADRLPGALEFLFPPGN
jgi:enterochelin esterase-like enzyme